MFDPFFFSDDVFEDDDLDFSPFPSTVPWVTEEDSCEGEEKNE